MKETELYDILTLEDDKDYIIANMLTYNDATYLYLIEVDENEELIENNQMIVRKVMKEGEVSVEKIVNEEELQEVSKLFFELFKEMIDETTSEN